MIDKVKQFYLNVNFLKKKITSDVFYKLLREKSSLEIVNDPPKGKVLVLSPHPDDDILGSGCAIMKHIEQGDEVKIIYLTDGSLGFKDLKRPTDKEKKKLAADREIEARDSADLVGVKDLVFWRYRDGLLRMNKTSLGLMKNVIEEFKPEIIYVPWFTDPHPDHLSTSKILAQTLKTANLTDLKIMSYEVWAPIYANLILRSDKNFSKKVEAIKIHKTQNAARSYLEAFVGLAKYRAGMYDAGEYAEAYYSTDSRTFIELSDLVF